MRHRDFRSPPPEYSPVPLWLWNDELSDQELVRQLDEIAKGGWKGFYIVAAPGLVTPYLSGEWMEKVELVVKAAAERGMQAWLYDENIYPIGQAREGACGLLEMCDRSLCPSDLSPSWIAPPGLWSTHCATC